MKPVLAFLFAVSAWAQVAQPISYVTVDPSGACQNGTRMRYNFLNNRLWGCFNGTWAIISGSGGGSVFGGSTAVASAFTATPTFNLAAISNQSPVRFESGTLIGNVTSVTFTNKAAGAKFSIAWVQDGVGSRTVAYGGSANNTCTISPTAGVLTTQQFEIASDGTTVNGTGCSSTDTTSRFGSLVVNPTTVGSLPACNAGFQGARGTVTDSNVASFTAGIGTVAAGGGSTVVPVFCDGASWRIG